MQQKYTDLFARVERNIGRLAKEAPVPMGQFSALRKNAMREGALPGKVKELIALAIAIADRCEGCVSYHVHDALKAGATRAEIIEVIEVAIMMGGGPSVVFGSEALEAVDQFERGHD